MLKTIEEIRCEYQPSVLINKIKEVFISENPNSSELKAIAKHLPAYLQDALG